MRERVVVAYNEDKVGERIRTRMSLQSRISDLCLPVSKLHGHIHQIEHQNPSGASEEWIFKKAKESLQDDPTFKRKKFQFYHVWPILKNAEKWLDNAAPHAAKPRRRNQSSEGSQTGSRTTETYENPSFCADLNADEDEQEYINDELASQERPIGTKMPKMRRKAAKEKKKVYKKIIADNKAIKKLLEKNMLEKSSFASKIKQYTSNKLNIQRQCDEDKIMVMSLDSITDPLDREFLKMRKTYFMQRRARESQSQELSPTFGYDNFNNLNQFQSCSESTFYSENFGSTFSFGFGGSSGYGGASYARGSSQFGTNTGEPVPEVNQSARFERNDGYGGTDANIPEY